MKVKVIKRFRDKHTGEIYEPGQTIEVTEERRDEILTVDKLIESIPASKEKKETAAVEDAEVKEEKKETAKKRTTRKK